MEKQAFLNQIRGLGWEVSEDNIDFRKEDPVLWHGHNQDNPILEVKRVLACRLVYAQLIAVGDIRIYGEQDQHGYMDECFVYKEGKEPSGKLTRHLRLHGRWENNNWFEINIDKSSFSGFEEPFHDLTVAADAFLERLSKYEVAVESFPATT